MKLYHVIESAEIIAPRRGLIVERDQLGTWTLHLIVGLVWPVRRWFRSDYMQAFISAKPMYWARLSLYKHTMPWFLSRGKYGNLKLAWIWGVFEFARGVMAFPDEEADRSRLIAMRPEAYKALIPRSSEESIEDAFQAELARWRL